MSEEKQLLVKLFFTRSTFTFYVQIGKEMIFKINDKIATAIQSKEKLHIHHVDSIKDIQSHEQANN